MRGTQETQINPAAVELHIDELVLHGFAPGDRHAIALAVEHELSRLLSAQFAEGLPGSFAQSSEHEHIDAGAFNVSPGAHSNSVGSQIAQTVHRGLTK